MKAKLLIYALALVCLGPVLFASTATHAATVRLTPTVDELAVGLNLESLRDPGNQHTIDSVQELPFNAVDRANPSFGFTDDAVWLRFSVHADYAQHKEWVLEIAHPLLDRVELYSPTEDGAWNIALAGDKVAPSERDLNLRSIAFSLPITATNTQTHYIRISSGSSIVTPVTITEKGRYLGNTADAATGLGLFYGSLLIMALFNLVLFVAMRDSIYLLYSAAVISTALFQASLSGHAQHFLWPQHPEWSNPLSLLSLVFIMLASLGFSIRFLDTKTNVPTIHWGILAVMAAGVGLIPIYYFAGYSTAISLGAMLSVMAGVVGLIAGIWCLRKNVYSAKFYVLARTGFCIGSILTAGRQLGAFPDTFITEHGMRIGSLLESVLLAFALSDRYNLLRAEKEAAQKQTADELLRLDKLKDEILANTSHELRTPLQGIIGVSESMLDGAAGELSKPARQNLSMMVSSGKRLSRLVDDILDFSRLKTHELRIEIKPVDLRVAVDVVLTMLKPLLQSKSVKLVNEVSEDLPAVLADETRLQQILTNLVGNAIKFTDKGEVQLNAEVLADGMVRVDIIDSGIGMEHEAQLRIFESFQQAEGSNTRQRGGTGLGLSVSKKLVELQGGVISVSSQLGRGSTFSFTLPTTHEEVQESLPEAEVTSSLDGIVLDTTIQSNTEIAQVPNRIETENQVRILVVDDEPINQQVLSNHLSLAHYSVVQAMNGAEALRLIDEGGNFDLVLLDVMMPNMSGYEVCQRIRQTHLATELPIIMVTAKTQSDDLVTGLGLGANDYIAKPFSKKELLARIETHLGLMQINTAYGNFVPREFLNHLGKESIIDVRLGDNVELEIAVMWSDIRGFSSLLETMTPEDSFDFINGYFGRMGPVIREYGGFINSFVGDAILALYVDGPNDAVAAALASCRRLDAYNAERAKRGRHTIVAGFAVHIGPARLGVVGEIQRRQGEVFSDAINLTSRIEVLTKLYKSRVIISADVAQRLSPGAYSLRKLDRVKVKGRNSEVELYEVLDELVDRELREQTRDEFEAAISAELAGNKAAAIAGFESVLTQNPDDHAARFHIEKINRKIDTKNQFQGSGKR